MTYYPEHTEATKGAYKVETKLVRIADHFVTCECNAGDPIVTVTITSLHDKMMKFVVEGDARGKGPENPVYNISMHWLVKFNETMPDDAFDAVKEALKPYKNVT